MATARQDPLRALLERADSLSTLGGVITAVLTAATATVLGGIVFAIRLDKVNLPVEEGLRAIPRETLVLVGVRELLLALLVTLVLLALARSTAAAFVAALVLVLIVPLTAAGLAWPVAVFFVWLGSRHIRNVLVVVVGTFVLACAVTLARFDDPPFAFSSAELVRAFDAGGCDGLTSDTTRLCGSYLGKRDDGLYLGQPRNGRILFVPNEGYKAVLLLPPPAPRPPRTSLLGRLTDRAAEPFSLTPLDLWIGDERKGGYLFR